MGCSASIVAGPGANSPDPGPGANRPLSVSRFNAGAAYPRGDGPDAPTLGGNVADANLQNPLTLVAAPNRKSRVHQSSLGRKPGDGGGLRSGLWDGGGDSGSDLSVEDGLDAVRSQSGPMVLPPQDDDTAMASLSSNRADSKLGAFSSRGTSMGLLTALQIGSRSSQLLEMAGMSSRGNASLTGTQPPESGGLSVGLDPAGWVLFGEAEVDDHVSSMESYMRDPSASTALLQYDLYGHTAEGVPTLGSCPEESLAGGTLPATTAWPPTATPVPAACARLSDLLGRLTRLGADDGSPVNATDTAAVSTWTKLLIVLEYLEAADPDPGTRRSLALAIVDQRLLPVAVDWMRRLAPRTAARLPGAVAAAAIRFLPDAAPVAGLAEALSTFGFDRVADARTAGDAATDPLASCLAYHALVLHAAARGNGGDDDDDSSRSVAVCALRAALAAPASGVDPDPTLESPASGALHYLVYGNTTRGAASRAVAAVATGLVSLLLAAVGRGDWGAPRRALAFMGLSDLLGADWVSAGLPPTSPGPVVEAAWDDSGRGIILNFVRLGSPRGRLDAVRLLAAALLAAPAEGTTRLAIAADAASLIVEPSLSEVPADVGARVLELCAESLSPIVAGAIAESLLRSAVGLETAPAAASLLAPIHEHADDGEGAVAMTLGSRPPGFYASRPVARLAECCDSDTRRRLLSTLCDAVHSADAPGPGHAALTLYRIAGLPGLWPDAVWGGTVTSLLSFIQAAAVESFTGEVTDWPVLGLVLGTCLRLTADPRAARQMARAHGGMLALDAVKRRPLGSDVEWVAAVATALDHVLEDVSRDVASPHSSARPWAAESLDAPLVL